MSSKRRDGRGLGSGAISAKRKTPAKSPPKPHSRRAETQGPPAPTARRPARQRRRGLGRRWWHWLFFVGAWAVVLFVAVMAYFWMTLPPIDNLTLTARRPSITLLGRDGTLIATYGDLYGKPVHLKDLPPYLPEAVIATEDHRFYYHFGIDPIGVIRAAVADLRAGHIVEGGSTLTQQLAKNLFLSPDRTFRRKIQEALLAIWLEQRFTKNQILEIYLNRVYFGAGAYGVDAAAHRYFNKPASQVTLYEAAVIAGLLKAPTRFSPAHNETLAAERAEQVLDAMKTQGYITEAQEQTALKGEAKLGVAQRAKPSSRYFADWIYEQIPEFAGLGSRDLVITTTLDPKMQAAAEAAVSNTLDKDGGKYNVGQGALVAMTPDGAIRAMVGGRDYAESQFNRATQALRQPGSAFKPIVYATALERGMSPRAHFDDHRIRIGNWEPRNYEHKYRGEVSVADALAYSINTVAAQVIERTGVGHVINLAHRLGITSDMPHNDSLALGTNEVTLLELTAAYAAFANGGTAVWPYGVVEIKDASGKIVYKRSGSGPSRVLSARVAGTMNRLLQGVIARGTGRAARIDRQAAGKTGTTQDFRDALFVGYTANLVTGVWFGNDDNTPMKRVTGGTLPARTWHDFMAVATKGLPPRPLPGPPAVAPTGIAAKTPSSSRTRPELAAGHEADRSGLQRLLDHIFGTSHDHTAPAHRPTYPVPQSVGRYR